MPCAAGELCTLPKPHARASSGIVCRGRCGGRLHGDCGEVEDPDGNNPMHHICPACADVKSSTKDTTTASAKHQIQARMAAGRDNRRPRNLGQEKRIKVHPARGLLFSPRSLRFSSCWIRGFLTTRWIADRSEDQRPNG